MIIFVVKSFMPGMDVDIEVLKTVITSQQWLIGMLLANVLGHKGVELGKNTWAKKDNIDNDLQAKIESEP